MKKLWRKISRILFGYEKKRDASTDIIDALLTYWNTGEAVQQLVPVCKKIKWLRTREATEQILKWAVKQYHLSESQKNNIPIPETSPGYFHIEFDRAIWIQGGMNPPPYVDADILLLLSIFKGESNYFIANKRDFGFASHLSMEDRFRISKRVFDNYHPHIELWMLQPS